MLKNPGFMTVAVLTLALGIGANTAIFSVVNAVLINPLPYADPNRLVLVKEVLAAIGSQPVTVSAPDIAQIDKQNRVFDGVAGFRVWSYELSGQGGSPERVIGERVGYNLFSVLGVAPIIGRTFTAQEDQPGQTVAILSYGLWQRHFGGDRDVAGKTIQVDRQPYTVVGVMPQSLVFPLPGMAQGLAADLFVPLALSKFELSNVGDNFDFGVVARMKPGVTATQANADLTMVARGILETYARWARDNHENMGDMKLGVVAQPLAEQVVGPTRPMLLMLLGAVGFVLLIACANVANLLLARAVSRRKEMAIRLAMGAGSLRLLRQLLVEGLLLSFCGGGLGLLLAVWIKDALVGLMPVTVPRFRPIELDLPVLLFTFALAVATGVVFGILPALSAARTELNQSLKDSARGASQGAPHIRLRATLVAVEVALSVILLAGAGLLVRSFQRVLDTQPGFQPEHVLTAGVNLPPSQYKEDAQVFSFYKELLARVRRMPGAKAAGTSTDIPLNASWTHLFTPEGYVAPSAAEKNVCNHSVIFGDYLQSMGIPLLRGRYFTDQDTADSTRVLIVSDALAKRYWPNQDPIGKRLKWGTPEESRNEWMTVVGVAGDVKQASLETATTPHTYQPNLQLGAITALQLAVRAEGDPSAVTNDLRAVVAGMDPQLALARVRTMNQVIQRTTSARRFSLFLLASFAALALVLAAIGIYGVLAYSVTQRIHEIGVRMALGAEVRHVVRLVLKQGAMLAGIGMAVGAAGALLVARALQDMLYQVRPADPVTFAAVLAAIGVVALGASYIPARRATKVDPLVALRHE
jgi:putative ABC transport system permease protein